MRDSLTVLASLLIVVLTAALVGPYFVDWGAHRGLIERQLSATAGTPVTVAGPISLTLLPKPIFRLGSVALGGGGPGRPRLSAAQVDAELSLTALLRGQVQVVDATLLSPHLDLAQGPDGALDVRALSDDEADRVAIDHVGVRGGSVAVRLADGRRLDLSGIDLDGEATTLRGPFKARGTLATQGLVLPFRLATGALDRGRMRVKLRLDPEGSRPGIDLDGTLAAGIGPLGFDGTAIATGQVSLAGTPAAVPWRATAHATADTDRVALNEVELRGGTDMRAVIANGTGAAARGSGPGAVPALSLALHGAGLDLDRLAVPPQDGATAPPPGPEILRQFAERAQGALGQAALPFRLDVDVGFDTVTLGGRTLLGTAGTLALGPEPGAQVAVSTLAPDGARVKVDGHLAAGPAFRGRVDAAAPDLARSVAWIRPVAPALADALTGRGAARSATVAGALEASPAGATLRDLTLALDATRLTGSLGYAVATATAADRLTADLVADRLDLDLLPDLSRLGVAGADLDLALSARSVRLSAAALGASGGAVEAGDVALRLLRRGQDLRLDRLALALDGATVEASGTRDGRGAAASARIDAPRLGAVAALARRLFPGDAAAAIEARAAALSPFAGTLRIEAAGGAGDLLAPTRLGLDGTANGTRIAAALVPGPPAPDLAARALAVTLDVEAPDAALALRQAGLAAPDGLGGALRLTGTATGSFAAGFAVEARATLGGAALSYAGRADAGRANGRLTLDVADPGRLWGAAAGGTASPGRASADLAWAGTALTLDALDAHVAGTAASGALALDLSRPPPGSERPLLTGRLRLDRLPAAALMAIGLGAVEADRGPRGGGLVPSTPFGPAPPLLRADVAVAVGEVPILDGLTARDVTLGVQATRAGVTLAAIAGHLGPGTFAGSVDLRRDGASASVSGRVTVEGGAAEIGGLKAAFAAGLRFAGAGDSPAALVASLGGTGTLTLDAAALARTDPAAPARVAASFDKADPAADPDPRAPEPDALRQRLAAELDRAPLTFPGQSVPLVLSGGSLRPAPLRADPPKGDSAAAAATAEASLDLGRPALTVRTRLPLGPDAGRDGEVVVTDAMEAGGPARRAIDAQALATLVQTRAAARAQERIDVIEQDIRERAAFNRQLKAIRADQQAARERAAAEAEARRLEAQRAKAEADRIQAEVQAAARADAARAEAEKRKANARDPTMLPLPAAPPSIIDDPAAPRRD